MCIKVVCKIKRKDLISKTVEVVRTNVVTLYAKKSLTAEIFRINNKKNKS